VGGVGSSASDRVGGAVDSVDMALLALNVGLRNTRKQHTPLSHAIHLGACQYCKDAAFAPDNSHTESDSHSRTGPNKILNRT
jgi:hypothetical protein